ncbi:DUF5931 domain-containing protein [Allorhizocola rhizosphaerae]|uniref:ATP-binding protein n=1 Tax=Allorhizocola rhizosphaerae TaxID=1872709 RepID=UPI000E3DCAE0|nr:DUF5931 domain-containing protein [Allorhizocola rhizosphaerae]
MPDTVVCVPVGLEVVLWRAVAVFRFAALAYAVVLLLTHYPSYHRVWLAWTTIGVMALWTTASAVLYGDPGRRGWPLLVADMVVTVGCLLTTTWVVPREELGYGAHTLPMAWVAGAVLAWAIHGGRRWGAIGALIVGAADLLMRGQVNTVTLNGTVLLLLAGMVVGYLVRRALDAEERLQRAVELEAATRERERLARGIHDSVLQALALISRRAERIGGETLELGRLASSREAGRIAGEVTELGRLAAEQSEALRALVSVQPPPLAKGMVDLRESLGALAAPHVSLAFPAQAVLLRDDMATEVTSAAAAALDNVRVHCGPSARAWVLVEDEGTTVTVTIRDDGPGMPDGRLEEAARAGRLGVQQSMRGRMRDSGGQATITSRPGEGTEVELKVPRA